MLVGVCGISPLSAQTVHTEVLDNGLSLVAQRSSRSHLVQLRLLVKAAPVTEGDLLGSGVSDLVRQLVVERLRADQGVSAKIESEVTADVTTFAITTSDRQFAAALQALVQAVQLADIGNEAVVAARRAQLARIAAAAADPQAIERAALHWTVYRQHPDRLPAAGLASQLEALEPVMVRSYHKQRYTAPAMALVVVGNLPLSRVRHQVEQLTEALPLGRWPTRTIDDEPLQQAERIVQTGVVPRERELVVWRTQPLSRPGIFKVPARDGGGRIRQQHHLAVLTVAAELLGQDNAYSPLRRALADGRLATSIRVEHRIVPTHSGWFAIGFEPDADQGPAALLAVHGVIKHLITNGPEIDDLAAAKASLRRRLQRQFATVDGLASHHALWWRATAEAHAGERFLKWVDDVRPEDIQNSVGLWLREGFRNQSRIILQAKTEDPPKLGGPVPPADGDVKPNLVRDLPGGASLLTHDLSQYGATHVGVTIGGGWSIERADDAGGLRLLAALLSFGHEGLQGQDFARNLARQGMDLDIRVDVHGLHIGISCFPERQTEAIHLLIDLIKRPALPNEEVEAAIRDALAVQAAEDGAGWDERLLETVHGEVLADHYGAGHGLGTKQSLNGFTRERLLNVFRTITVGENMIFWSYGDVGDTQTTRGTFAAALEAAPAVAQGVELIAPGTAWPEEAVVAPVSLSWARPGSAVALSWRGVPAGKATADGPVLDILAALLVGDGVQGGRLRQALDKLADCELLDLRLASESYAQRGLWTILVRYDGTATGEQVREMITRVVTDLARRVADAAAVSDAELARARFDCERLHAERFEDLAHAARRHAAAALRGRLTHLHVYPKVIREEVSREKLAELANTYLLQGVPPLAIELTSQADEPAVAPIPDEDGADTEDEGTSP